MHLVALVKSDADGIASACIMNSRTPGSILYRIRQNNEKRTFLTIGLLVLNNILTELEQSRVHSIGTGWSLITPYE